MRLPRGVRAYVNEAIAVRAGQRVDPLIADVRRLERALEDTTARLDREALQHRAEIEDLRQAQSARVDDLHRRLDDLDRRVRDLEEGHAWHGSLIARMEPQVASFEQRLERAARPIVVQGGVADLPEARELVASVRDEHARVRARLALISSYEERLRLLEEHADRVSTRSGDGGQADRTGDGPTD